MAGRFPGARNIREFWSNLCSGVESINCFTDEELDPGIDPSLMQDPDYVKARGVLEEAESFDASFFGITPREAQITDPQHRVFLETAWEALEDAGYDSSRYDGLIGVFGGAGFNTYLINNIMSNQQLFKAVGEHQINLGNAPDYLTTRVSYKLDLKGPAISLYTGCSSSLVAVSCALDSLLSYQCDIALAGGVFVWSPQNSGYLYQQGEIFSASGHCRPFDSRADGTVFSNGVGLVVLTRLDEAIKDRDNIYALIRGAALNNDGSGKMSFAAPSVEGQAQVVAMALANAGVSPETISYLEAHGTGTIIGDPIEVEALNQAFKAGTRAGNFCAIGSIKANVGHLDAAAGVAGLIKAALALKHRQIPPSINFERANPQIDFTGSPFFVNTELMEWPSDNVPRRAGVTSLGVGGTNGHVVLEEPPPAIEPGPSRPMNVLLLSAKTESALDSSTKKHSSFLQENSDVNMADVAYTLQTGRRNFSFRRFVVCEGSADAAQALIDLPPKRSMTRQAQAGNPEVVFMFPGQGSQYVNMGLSLYQHETVFRQAIDQCAEVLKNYLDLDIREIIYPRDEDLEKAADLLRQTGFQQPALFAIEYALARLWQKWGIGPSAMIGHSIGEYVAACLAGVFSLEHALMLVAARGRMMQDLPAGSMLSIRLPAEEIKPKLNGQLSLAVVNAPALCVVSGPTDEVEVFQKDLEEQEIMCRFLHTSHAFHSPMMDSIVEPFTEKVRSVPLYPSKIPYVSTATGTWVTSKQATDPVFWGRQLRQPVLFAQGISALWENPERVLLEVGPRNTATTLARQQIKNAARQTVIPSLGHTADNHTEYEAMLCALGHLWLTGAATDWKAFYENEQRYRAPLPTYPFERKRHWVDIVRQKEEPLTSKSEAVQADSAASASAADKPRGLSGSLDHPDTDMDRGHARNIVKPEVTAIWQDLLGVEQVGAQDNFFDLGGDSMVAARLLARIEKAFNKKISPDKLYEAQTLERLSELLSDEPATVNRAHEDDMPYKIIEGDIQEHKQEILGLWKRNFPVLNEDRFIWTYENNPSGPAVCVFVKDVKKDSIVGVHALFPRQVYVKGKARLASLGSDLAVDREHRVLAPAIMLQDAVISQCNNGRFDLFYGFPNKESESVNQMLGLQMFDVLRMTRPLRSDYYFQRRWHPSISKVLSSTYDLAARTIAKETRYKRPNGLTTEILSAFDQRFDTLWQKVSAQLPVIGERSSAYLNWRYIQSPHHDHSVFTIAYKPDREILGYVVFHTDGNKTFIDDILCQDMNKTIDALLSEFLLFQRKNKMESVSVRFAGTRLIIDKFKEFGFSVRDREDKVTVYIPPDSPELSFLSEEENWYFMPGDKDI